MFTCRSNVSCSNFSILSLQNDSYCCVVRILLTPVQILCTPWYPPHCHAPRKVVCIPTDSYGTPRVSRALFQTFFFSIPKVLEVMHKFDCVAMFLSGHRHRETYVRDDHGIHHVSLAAALEAPPDQVKVLELSIDRLTCTANRDSGWKIRYRNWNPGRGCFGASCASHTLPPYREESGVESN